MIIGIPKEIKDSESRVALTPEGVSKLVKSGHSVLIERSAGEGSGFSDKEYAATGAKIVKETKTVWDISETILKVKEPQRKEWRYFRPGQIIFTYLHLAAEQRLAHKLKKSGVTAIDYATIEAADGSLPLLKPMSEIAGKLAAQIGARFLEKNGGGKGVLLGGTEKVPPSKVLVLGGGTVGSSAAEIALGMGAKVFLLDKNQGKIESLKKRFGYFNNRFSAILSSEEQIQKLSAVADLIIGAVLIPGAKAPKILTEKMVKKMAAGSVIVDVAIDQGGCVATSRPTSHKKPVFIKHGVLHYCVPNIPGVVPRTATQALSMATLPSVLLLADKGFERAVKENPAFAKGVNVWRGRITHQKLAESLSDKYTPM